MKCTFTNSENPDEMQHYAAFHLGLHCLQKYSFRGFPEYKGLRSFRPVYAACCYFLQEVTVEVLVEGLKKCSGAKGIIVNGYPRSMVQVGEYNKVVSMPTD